MTSNFDDSEKKLLEEQTPNEVTIESNRPNDWNAPKPPLRAWRFWVPLLLQTALIASIPAQAVYTHLTGKTAILQTAPVDPYDLLRGYSQTLSYDISITDNLKKIPGWKELEKPKQENAAISDNNEPLSLYVILEAPTKQELKGRPKPWKPVQVSRDRPTHLKANQVAIEGKYSDSGIKYGLETYYMPEDQRDRINDEINQAMRAEAANNPCVSEIECNPSESESERRKQPFVVEVKVDERGHAVPISLWVRDRNYRF